MSMTIVEALRYIGADVPESTHDPMIYCPFHKGGKERNRSAKVYLKSDSMHCFTCGRSYSPVTVIMTHFGVSKTEAIKIAGGGRHVSPVTLDRVVAEFVQMSLSSEDEALIQQALEICSDAMFGKPDEAILSRIRSIERERFPRLA